jgi:hypothetical protein
MFYATATTEISEAQQEGYTNEESNLCAGKKSFSYKANGEQHFVPYEVIDDQVVIEGDIVVGSAEDLLKGGANYVPPVVLDLIDGQWTRWGNGVAPYVVPFVIDSSAEGYRSWIREATLAWSCTSICSKSPAPRCCKRSQLMSRFARVLFSCIRSCLPKDGPDYTWQ